MHICTFLFIYYLLTWNGQIIYILELNAPARNYKLAASSRDTQSLSKNSTLRKCGKNERSLMKIRSIVLQLLLDVVRGLPRRFVALTTALSGNDEANLATWISRDGGVGISCRGVELTDAVHKWLDDVNVEPHAFPLSTDNAALSESAVHGFVKRCFE